jgi:hypothetical protein
MVDPDTFLTTLDVMADDLCQSQLPPEVHQVSRPLSAGVALPRFNGLSGLYDSQDGVTQLLYLLQ